MQKNKQSPPKPKERRIPERINLSDASSSPGLHLMERIAHRRNPLAEDLAILESWAFRFPVTIVQKLPDSNDPIRLAGN